MQLLLIILLVLMNGVLAMSEIAVVSARHGRLQEAAERGSRGASTALELVEEPNRFLSTVQIGITLVGVGAGALGGATVGRQFGEWLAANTPLAENLTEPVGVAGIVLLTTYLSLVLGELVPKRLAMQYADAISIRIAIPMKRLSVVTAPIVWILSQSTDLILRLIGIDPTDQPSVSNAEVIHMVKEGSSEGVFPSHEVDMVRGVLELDDIRVIDIMTPRPDLNIVNLTDDVEAIKSQLIATPHSYYPVCDGDIDKVIGMIKAKDLLMPMVAGDAIDLRKLMRPPLFIPQVLVAARALEIFKSSGQHIGMVVGEHGGVEGLITINDIFEEIVGDIDADEAQRVVHREDGSWSLDGLLELDRFEDFLPEGFPLPQREIGHYRTLAGFIMARLDRVPVIGDHFIYEGLRFEVLDMDGARIDRVLVNEVEESES